jgi:hypothetical protein
MNCLQCGAVMQAGSASIRRSTVDTAFDLVNILAGGLGSAPQDLYFRPEGTEGQAVRVELPDGALRCPHCGIVVLGTKLIDAERERFGWPNMRSHVSDRGQTEAD